MLRHRFAFNLRHPTIIAVLSLLAATQPTEAQTYTLLHSFFSVPDGGAPNPIIEDAHGNIYGTTRGGGVFCFNNLDTCGTVYRVDPSGDETVLYAFQGGNDGALPQAALTQDAAGNLYGNTEGNGNIGASSTIFKIDTSGKETVLWDFDGPPGGGAQESPLALDKAGNIYGSTPFGGDLNCGYQASGCGSLYRLTTARTMQLIHIFKGTDGIQPEGGLVVGVNGDAIYGTTIVGGILSCYTPNPKGLYRLVQGCGTIFKLDRTGKLTTLYSFTGGVDGSAPLGLIQDPQGNLYGIASYGGGTTCTEDPYGCGTIFKVDTGGNFSVLYRFTSAITQPDFASRLVRDSTGNLYGVNAIGGANFSGFLFKVTPTGEFSILFNFPSTTQEEEGSIPQGVTMDSAGNFYGSMLIRGIVNNNCPVGCGTVFKISF